VHRIKASFITRKVSFEGTNNPLLLGQWGHRNLK
jgi:hypothetical protein